jgi:amino acid adenylation domain-containing protein
VTAGNGSTQLTLEEKRKLLLRRMIAQAGHRPAAQAEVIPRRPDGATTPASFAQQRLWFLDRLVPGNPFYTVSLSVQVNDAVSIHALGSTLDEIVRRHEALRTTFAEIDGQPVQVIATRMKVPLETIDLRNLPLAAAEQEAERLTTAESERRFDLETGPLIIAKLVMLAYRRNVLLLTLHHIVCDGWSLRVLARELQTIYAAQVSGKEHGLRDPVVQYADFSAWQRRQVADAAFQEHLAYWKDALKDAPEIVLIPDKVETGAPSFRGAFIPVWLPWQTAQPLRRVAADEGATPFMVLVAGFMILLGRYGGLDDIVVGAPVASRARPELEDLIGFFVNTLVLRADLSGEPDFRSFLRRVRQTCLDAFSHQDVPFDQLVQTLAPERQLGRNPLFQVIFQLFSAPDGALGSAQPSERQRGTSKFDLRLDLWEAQDGYRGELEYNVDLFEADTVRLMARHLENLLVDATSRPDAPISQLEMMSPDERQTVVETWNNTSRPCPLDKSVVTLFREQLARAPDATAVVYADGTLTFRDLDDRSNALAARLLATGVAPRDRVGIFLERSAAMVVAWLATLKLRAAYVPLDTGCPALRVADLMEDCGARKVITTTPLAEGLQPSASYLIVDELPPGESVALPEPESSDIAYVMYTSGSTGAPKGVLIDHRAIVRLTVNTDYLDLLPGETVAQASNAAFDAATFEVWAPLLNGGRVVGLDRDTVLSAPALRRQINEARIDHLFLTTALFNRLVQDDPAIFGSLKTLLTGGSKCDPERFREVLRSGRPGSLVHVYGPTETTAFATAYRVAQLAPEESTVPIGSPIANTTAYVLDRHKRLAPIGVPGQLYIGGPGVAVGYHRRPDLTTERFVADPFRAGERLYASGDKVRRRPNGAIEFIGRFDDQVKIRGFRVELNEITSTLLRHPAVRETIVLVLSDAGDDDSGRLVAYIVADPAFDAIQDNHRAAQNAIIGHWRSIYDSVIYGGIGDRKADPTFEIAGWTDTATGAALTSTEMAEQVDETVERIRRLGAKRILEIGCGTGLLLHRLAPEAERYIGTDISERALDFVRRTIRESGGPEQVELRYGAMEALAGLRPGSFDLAIMNSVVQYFPSVAYLDAVLDATMALLAPNGSLFIGDVRHYGLLAAFHAGVALTRTTPGSPVAIVREAIDNGIELEQELFLDPAYFLGLAGRFPRVRAAQVLLKRGTHHNELTRYRYDVIAGLDHVATPVVPEEWIWGRDVDSTESLVRRLLERPSGPLRIRRVPNARVAVHWAAARLIGDATKQMTVEDLVACAAIHGEYGVDPEELWALGDSLGVSVAITWSPDDGGAFDALFVEKSLAGCPIATDDVPATDASPAEHATSPEHGHFYRNLVPELQSFLQARLPDYMMPSAYVRLSALPLNANGKVDKAALPIPRRLRPVSGPQVEAPRTDTERAIAAIFERVLNMTGPNIRDHFFNDLGGHSLLATRVISQIRAELKVDLPLRLIFEDATISALAGHVERLRTTAPAELSIPELVRLDSTPDFDALHESDVDAALAAFLAERRERP